MKLILLIKPTLINIEKYERWLEEKAYNGLELKKKFGVFHIFKKSKEEKVRYFLDINEFFQNVYAKEKNKVNFDSVNNEVNQYEDLYKQSGWELVYKTENIKPFSSTTYLHLWKQGYIEERPEAITDTDSLIKLYKNNMIIAMAILILESFWGIYAAIKFENNIIWYLFLVIFFNIIMYYLIASIRSYKKYKDLKIEKGFNG